jgi:prepilin-type N-terminal cleavage/methylation domain-containing protein
MKKDSMYARVKNFGFTILELIVVVAIIGILTSVVLVSLSNQRSKAKIASAQTTMNSVMPLAVTCLDDNSLLNETTVGGLICDATESVWPELTSGWSYVASPVSDTDTNTFSFSATDGVNTISCSEASGCVVTP